MTTILARDDLDFVYLPLPRCGSTWLTAMLDHHGFTKRFTEASKGGLGNLSIDDKIKVCIFRDPLERLVSGLHVPEDWDLDIIYDREKIFNVFPTDVHTSTQVSLLKGVSLDNTMFLRYANDNTWANSIKNFFKQHIPNFEVKPYDWVPLQGRAHYPLMNVVLSNKEVYNNLMEYLKEDWDFYNQIKWHETD